MVTLDGNVPQYLIHISFSSTPSGYSLRKQPTFGDASASTGLPAKWRLRNERRNSILITRHYPVPVSASDWLIQFSHAARPIRSTTQIWVVTCYSCNTHVTVSAMVCYYKVRQLFYYKVRQVLLQSATGITKWDNFITKCGRYYKVRRLSQSATERVVSIWNFYGRFSDVIWP